MIYKNCKIYRKSDPDQNAVVFVDIDSETPMSSFGGFSGGGLDESSQYTVTTVTDFNYISGNFNIIIPEMGDFKITGWQKTRENVGMWKVRYRYRLTLEN